MNTFSSDDLLTSSLVPLSPDGYLRRQTSHGYDGLGRTLKRNDRETSAAGAPIGGRDAGAYQL